MGEIIKPPQNIITVKGESIQFNCSVQGNLSAPDTSSNLKSYWGVIFPITRQQRIVYIDDNDTNPFFIALYQTCLTDNGSCCNFISRLTIQYVTLEYSKIKVSCNEYLDGNKSSNHQEFATLST